MNQFNILIIFINIIYFILCNYSPIYYINSIYCPFVIFKFGEYSRLITHAFAHQNIQHLLMNMLAFFQLNKSQAIIDLNMITFLSFYFVIYNFVYLTLAYFSFNYFAYTTLYFSRNLGFSGIIFALRYLSYYTYDRDSYVLIYGTIEIRKKYMILVDLILTHILVPMASLEGHVIGAFTGFLMKYFNLL